MLPETRHAPLRCSKRRRHMAPMTPKSATAGGTVLLHSNGFSTIDRLVCRLVYWLSAIFQFPLMNTRRYFRLTRVARAAFFARISYFSVWSIRSTETLDGIPVLSLNIALWVFLHRHIVHFPSSKRSGLTD